MEHKEKLASAATDPRKIWRFLFDLVLFLSLLALCVHYIRLTATPMSSYDLSPASDLLRWSFSLEDGTVLQPEDGEFPANGTDMVVVCQTPLTEEMTDQPLFVVNAVRVDCVCLLNDMLVYSPSGRFVDGCFSEAEYTPSAASGQFVAHPVGEDDTLTIIVQFQGEDRSVKLLPRLTEYPSVSNYHSQSMAATAEAAFPAGMYFALALLLSGLFFIGAWKSSRDYGLLLLAFCSLSMSLSSTVPYAFYAIDAFQWAGVSWFCSVLPLVAMGWTLWYRLRRKIRLFTLPVISAVTIASLYYLLASYGQGATPLGIQMTAVQTWILPAVIALLLLVGAVDAAKGNPWFRRFFRYLAYSIPAVALAWGFSTLTGGKLAQTLKTALARLTASHSFFIICQQLCVLLLILCFIQAVVDLISSLARRDAEIQALSLREKYASENVALMLKTQESTRRERHEMSHHVALLSEMLADRQFDRANEYIHTLSEQVSALPSDAYSGNLVINAIAGRYLNDAKAEGINVTADIRAADKTILRDEELCVLLTNMLENALEACRAMPKEAERFIRFEFFSSDEHLTVSCENSTDAAVTVKSDGSVATSKEDTEHHGYGIAAMRRIVEKRDGKFSVSCADGCFTVKATM